MNPSRANVKNYGALVSIRPFLRPIEGPYPGDPLVKLETFEPREFEQNHSNMESLDVLLHHVVDGTPLRLDDFDDATRMKLNECMRRDPTYCRSWLFRMKNGIASKSRSEIRNWRAYVFKAVSCNINDIERVESSRPRNTFDDVRDHMTEAVRDPDFTAHDLKDRIIYLEHCLHAGLPPFQQDEFRHFLLTQDGYERLCVAMQYSFQSANRRRNSRENAYSQRRERGGRCRLQNSRKRQRVDDSPSHRSAWDRDSRFQDSAPVQDPEDDEQMGNDADLEPYDCDVKCEDNLGSSMMDPRTYYSVLVSAEADSDARKTSGMKKNLRDREADLSPEPRRSSFAPSSSKLTPAKPSPLVLRPRGPHASTSPRSPSPKPVSKATMLRSKSPKPTSKAATESCRVLPGSPAPPKSVEPVPIAAEATRIYTAKSNGSAPKRKEVQGVEKVNRSSSSVAKTWEAHSASSCANVSNSPTSKVEVRPARIKRERVPSKCTKSPDERQPAHESRPADEHTCRDSCPISQLAQHPEVRNYVLVGRACCESAIRAFRANNAVAAKAKLETGMDSLVEAISAADSDTRALLRNELAWYYSWQENFLDSR